MKEQSESEEEAEKKAGEQELTVLEAAAMAPPPCSSGRMGITTPKIQRGYTPTSRGEVNSIGVKFDRNPKRLEFFLAQVFTYMGQCCLQMRRKSEWSP